MSASIWKIQLTQSSNSNSCCKNGQVSLELFFEVHFKGPRVLWGPHSSWGSNVVILSSEEKTLVVFNIWPQALHKGETTTFCCLLRRNDLSFTQKIKLANGPNAAFQQPWVAGHSVLQQSTEAVQPWTSTVLCCRRTLWTRLCFSIHFCYCTVYSRQAVKYKKLYQR